MDIRVEPRRSLRDPPTIAEAIDRLNLGSRRPTPYASAPYLDAFLAHDEFAGPQSEPLLLAAWEGSDCVGLLPLRRVRERVLGLPSRKVEFLVRHDSDRPCAIARAEDEGRVSRAFYRFLLREMGAVDAVELVAQDEASRLLPPPPDLLSGWHWRTLEGIPNASIPLRGVDAGAWFRSLDKRHRLNVARLARRLLGAGAVEYLSSDDPLAREPLLDLYLDLEQRSWKRQRGVGRHPARTALFRALCAPDMPHALSFAFLLLDGLPVAATIFGTFAGELIAEETTFDEAAGDLGPGNLLWVLTVGDAIERGHASMNLLGDFAYYKARWGARVVATRTLQIFRTGTPAWARARAGEVRRFLLGVGLTQADASYNLLKRASEGGQGEDGEGAAPPTDRPARAAQKALADEIRARLGDRGARLRLLSGPALLQRLPFGLQAEGAPKERRRGRPRSGPLVGG
jgi:CelD/BcsL family acetyltransferase involved in cellulose biosynthesis